MRIPPALVQGFAIFLPLSFFLKMSPVFLGFELPLPPGSEDAVALVVAIGLTAHLQRKTNTGDSAGGRQEYVIRDNADNWTVGPKFAYGFLIGLVVLGIAGFMSMNAGSEPMAYLMTAVFFGAACFIFVSHVQWLIQQLREGRLAKPGTLTINQFPLEPGSWVKIRYRRRLKRDFTPIELHLSWRITVCADRFDHSRRSKVLEIPLGERTLPKPRLNGDEIDIQWDLEVPRLPELEEAYHPTPGGYLSLEFLVVAIDADGENVDSSFSVPLREPEASASPFVRRQ